MFNSPEFTFTQETLNRLVPPDGKQHWYSEYLAVSMSRKGRYLEVFGYTVDRQEVDKEDENNRVCIFRVAFPRGGRRVRQSVFVIKGDFSIEKTDEHFLSDDS